MTTEKQEEITRISQEFASGFADTIGSIEGSGWLIVDPLSGYLNFAGFEHSIAQIPANEQHPQVLVLEFPDGDKFIPAGADLRPLSAGFSNWIWIPASA